MLNTQTVRQAVRASLGCALLIGASAVATAAEELEELEVVVVTAQFREQDVQRTPIAITAVNADMLEARSQTSINEVAAQAPSITLAPRGGAYGPSMAIYMRGVGQGDFNPAFEPGVGIYVDDVYFPTLTGSIMDLLDLDRVEILRGPQGTLAGRNSIGGAVKLYSSMPDGSDTGHVQATVGSRNRLDIRASGDFALTDSLFARLSGVSKTQDGYVERRDYGCLFPASGIPRNLSYNTDCVLAREGEVNYKAVRAILRWDNGGPANLTLIGDYTDDDRITTPSVLILAKPATDQGDGVFYTPSADVDPWGTGLGLADFVPPSGSYYNYGTYTMAQTANRPARNTAGRSYFRSWGVSAKLDWTLGENLQLESISAYRDFDSGFQNDNDLSPLNQQIGDGRQPFWGFSQELRLNGAAGDAVEWTLGAFYMDQRSWYPSYQDLRYSTLTPFQQNDPIDADAKAVFGHVGFGVSDRVTLIGGLRYTDESKQYEFSRRNPDGTVHGPLGGLDGVVGPYSGDKLDWRVGGQYQFNDTVMGYLQVATGFKGGGINPRPFYPEQAAGFGTESQTSYEIGVKSELMDRRMRLNAAVFLSDYKDIQTGATTCPPEYVVTGPICSLTLNAGTAEVMGVELETNIRPARGWTLDASLSYVDFEYTKISALAAGGEISIGNTAPFTPKLKWSTGIQYTWTTGNGHSITPRFDYSFNDKVYTNSSNLERSAIDSYQLANARLTWRDDMRGWEAALEITNLFDEYYFRSVYDAYQRAHLVSASPGRPREWGLTIKKRF